MIEKLYGKNINFLIGSGTSFGVIPTLSSNYINDKNEKLSIEEILEENKDDENLQNIIYLWYYHKILKIGYLEIPKENTKLIEKYKEVFKNYQKLLENLIKLLQRENYQKEKRINIFTTNYDLFFEKVADSLVGKYEFYFNDGSSGNITKKLSMKNYHKKIYHTGIFDNFDREIPIINLFKLHGSVSWKYINDKNKKPREIKVEYFEDNYTKYPENLIEEVSNKEIDREKKEIENNKDLKEKINKEIIELDYMVFNLECEENDYLDSIWDD